MSLNPVVYDTPMVYQPDDLSCWAATIAMVASGSLNDGSFYTVDQVIDFADEDGGGRFRGPVRWAAIKVAMERWGLRELAPASWPPEGWANLLNNYGPLGVVLRPDGNPDGLFHAVVLCGISGGGDPENTITTVNDPRQSRGRRQMSFLDFAEEWSLGAAANAMIMIDPSFTRPALPARNDEAPQPEEFRRLLDASSTRTWEQGPGPIDADPTSDGVIGAELTDAVNAGVSIVRLVANSASVKIDRTRVARAVPAALRPENLTDWAGPRRIAQQWTTPDSEWWEVWRAEYAFTLGAQFLFNGRRPGVAGQYLDDILLFLEVATLPADFTITATGHFPSTCHMFGSTTPVAGMPFAVDLEVKGFFGQLVSWSRTLSFNLFGDGRAEII